MTISAVNYTGVCDSLTTQAEISIAPVKTDENPEIAQINDETSEIQDTVEITENATAEDSVKAKGVLRLLQQGHFKGVSDVRLRINFADEISALESQKAAELAQSGLSNLTNMLNSKIDGAMQFEGHDNDTLTGITEAQDAFNSALTAITDEIANSSDSINLTDRLSVEFDEFSASLNSIFNPTETPEKPVGEELAISEEPPEVFPATLSENEIVITDDAPEVIPAELTEPEFDAQQFIDDLIATFTTELQKLEAELANISVLPPLSEPHGNGSAYQKFLTMYNEIRQVNDTPIEPAVDNIV